MEGSGSLPDGAFERFVTSALAAIITIVFSWRLLAEGQELTDGDTRPRFPRAIEGVRSPNTDDTEKQETAEIPIDENISSVENSELTCSQKYASLDSEPKKDDDSTPHGGDYSWEEDMYDTVHTRRNVKDFTLKRTSDSSSSDEMDPDIQLSPIPASHEMLEKLYMNQEYQSIVDDGQTDSSSSSDEDEMIEGIYEPPNIEDDMFYAGGGLEPIMEEDSDDFSDDENDEIVVNVEVPTDNEPEGTRQDLVKHQSDKNLTCTSDILCQADLTDDHQTLLDNYIDECFDQCDEENVDGYDSDKSSDSTDSLPPSPIIRTRAIDEEYANLSDESCSSGSVITVVSVKSYSSDTPEIQVVEESNKPTSFIYTDNESSISDNLNGKDIIAFIHGSDENPTNNYDLNKTPENDVLEKEIASSKTPTNLNYEDFIKDIKAVSETNNENGHETHSDEGNNETDAIISEQIPNHVVEELICQTTFANQKTELHISDNSQFDEIPDKQFEDRFDDDVGPREYNPYEDDFAEFDYCDSDDDSFYLVVGESNNLPDFATFNKADNGNLRNFDTFENLDSIGLASPSLQSPCESGLSDDGRFIFTRTEEIGTEFRTRVFVKEREPGPITSNITSHDVEANIKEVQVVDSEVENKNSYNESKLRNHEDFTDGDPIISDLENIELFIDENNFKENCSLEKNEQKLIDSKEDLQTNETLPSDPSSDINNSPSHLLNEACGIDLSINLGLKLNNVSLQNEEIDINGNSRTENEQKFTKAIKSEISELMAVSQNAVTNTTPEQNVIVNDLAINKLENDKLQEKEEFEKSLEPCIDILSRAHDSGIDLDSEQSKSNSTEECNKSPQQNSKLQIFDLLHSVKGQIDRSSAAKPSFFKGGTKARIQQQQKQRSKSYVSVLQQPMSPEDTRSVAVVLPEKALKLPRSRQQIIASRQKFLSEQNLFSDKMQEQFQQHKTSFKEVAQRKPRYVRRGNSLPRSSRTHKSYDKLDFNSLNSSGSSVEKPDICALHENCMFTPQKHQEIMDRTLSIDNLETSSMRYGSVTSLVETDIDSGETTEYQIFTDFENDFEFQFPLQRTASMSEIGSLSKAKTKKEIKSRFSDRNVPKSKSLCTLETNIDDDNDEAPRPGTLGRVPSVHELRVTKSLQKLNIPDWYKKSSVSRSGSTWSLYSSPRKDSISSSSYAYPPSITSSPCPSVSFGSNSVVIRTRVTPSSARLFRAPKLQTTPEKSPTPISVQLPSDKLRQKDKAKELMPIPIVPFSKLRLMFEESSRKRLPTALASSPTSPSSPTSTTAKSIESPTTPISPTTPLSPISVTPITSQIKSTTAPELSASKPSIPAKPILKKTTENKNVGRVEPELRQTAPVSVQPMSTSPRSGRRVQTTFNGTVGQAEVRKPKETTFEGDKPVQVVRPEVQDQKVTPQISNTAENQTEHNSKSGRYSSLSKSLKSAFRRPQKPSTVDSGGSKVETTV
ncbi:unnamed protein product [Mytilus edulis]|uniref:Uncharacterized protein n=1 Tax=Mytilus edulis TaxID=6550 RepID=A0A8S3SF95_MYTED|nr:unnamed protein product [Mytilus edulis]